MAPRDAGSQAAEDATSIIRTAGISAGTVRLTLCDLADKAAQLPPGELRKTWTAATARMLETLNDAQAAARLRGSDGWERQVNGDSRT